MAERGLQPEDEHDSSSDEDFNPDAQPAPADISSSEDEPKEGAPKFKRRRVDVEGQDDGLNFENSGDEATIRKGWKKRKDVSESEKDEGGEGGLVKTRAQRRLEEKEKKPLAKVEGATVNVDALWENMLTGQPAAQISEPLEHTEGKDVVIQNAKTVAKTDDAGQLEKSSGIPAQADALVGTSNNDEEMITIKRTYEFAGQTITEEKVVAKSSAEARLYLQSRLSPSAQPTQSASPIDPSKPSLRRPLKRTSRFEPNPTGEIKGLPAKQDKGVRLNTVQKSKMDWAGYVDKEGIANELDEHRKGKDNLLGRQDFLARVNGKKDDEWLNRKK